VQHADSRNLGTSPKIVPVEERASPRIATHPVETQQPLSEVDIGLDNQVVLAVNNGY